MKPLFLALVFFSNALLVTTALAQDKGGLVCEQQMVKAARTHGVPLSVLYAVGLTETGQRTGLSPYALNIAGQPYWATSQKDALVEITKALGRGVRLIDIGCMQINHAYHRAHFPSLTAMLVPAHNVDYAAKFLKSLYTQEKSWTRAVARYHAGPNNHPAQKRYICSVITQLVTSGLGAWTAQTRTFCNGKTAQTIPSPRP